MAKLLEQNVIEKMYELRAQNKMGTYHKIWDAIRVLTDNGLIADALIKKIEMEDRRMIEGAKYPLMFGTRRKG